MISKFFGSKIFDDFHCFLVVVVQNFDENIDDFHDCFKNVSFPDAESVGTVLSSVGHGTRLNMCTCGYGLVWT